MIESIDISLIRTLVAGNDLSPERVDFFSGKDDADSDFASIDMFDEVLLNAVASLQEDAMGHRDLDKHNDVSALTSDVLETLAGSDDEKFVDTMSVSSDSEVLSSNIKIAVTEVPVVQGQVVQGQNDIMSGQKANTSLMLEYVSLQQPRPECAESTEPLISDSTSIYTKSAKTVTEPNAVNDLSPDEAKNTVPDGLIEYEIANHKTVSGYRTLTHYSGSQFTGFGSQFAESGPQFTGFSSQSAGFGAVSSSQPVAAGYSSVHNSQTVEAAEAAVFSSDINSSGLSDKSTVLMRTDGQARWVMNTDNLGVIEARVHCLEQTVSLNLTGGQESFDVLMANRDGFREIVGSGNADVHRVDVSVSGHGQDRPREHQNSQDMHDQSIHQKTCQSDATESERVIESWLAMPCVVDTFA